MTRILRTLKQGVLFWELSIHHPSPISAKSSNSTICLRELIPEFTDRGMPVVL